MVSRYKENIIGRANYIVENVLPAICAPSQPLNHPHPENRQRHYISADALLALERLVIGRECNAFDRFTTERKSLAYSELIRLGLIMGTITETSGRSYPEVVVRGVTTAGNKVYQNHERDAGESNLGLRSAFIGVILLIIVAIIILAIRRG